MATQPLSIVPSCGPWKGISIFFVITSIIVIIIFIVLLVTKNITFGKNNGTNTPTQDQLITALKAGITVTEQDAVSKSTLTSKITLTSPNEPGIHIEIKSGITTELTPVPDIGGDGLKYRVIPARTGITPGVYYDIVDTPRVPIAPLTAGVTQNYRVTVDPTMSVVTYPPSAGTLTSRLRRT